MSAATYGVYDRRRPYHPALEPTDGLTIGDLRFAYADVAKFSKASLAERDWEGQLLCAGVYGMGSTIFLLFIMIGSLDMKFLIAVVFLAAICFMSVGDAMIVPTVVVHQLNITLRDGRQALFVDGDPRVIDALAQRLKAAGARES